MEWTLAHPLHDVEDIVNLADVNYGSEIDGILKRDRNVFRHRVTVATTEQIFNKSREFIAVCRGKDQVVALRNEKGELLGHTTEQPLFWVLLV